MKSMLILTNLGYCVGYEPTNTNFSLGQHREGNSGVEVAVGVGMENLQVANKNCVLESYELRCLSK